MGCQCYNRAMLVQTNSLQEFQTQAKEFTRSLVPSKVGATVVALSGELGAGKTTFTKEVAEVLGVVGDITSPTFVIEKVYGLPRAQSRGFARLIHIDAYRLTSEQELEVLGWREIVSAPENLILLEWPEHVAEIVPKEAIRIRLKVLGEDSREITYGQD